MNSIDSLIARTGRVQNWIDNPESRLPVSCTVFVTEDSMEGENGIEASWRFVSHALRNGAGVAVHLSKLRPAGDDNGHGLVSSGPVSFARIYSTLNETLRRGGVYKNGAVVVHLDINHADILEFVNASREALPWVKRCVNLTAELWLNSGADVKAAIIAGVARGDIWLNKIRYQNGVRIYANVCLEVYLPHRGTCLLQHVNLGACKVDQIAAAFAYGMADLCELHSRTGLAEVSEYLHPDTDRQVGLGILGLANLLAAEGVTYDEFGMALLTEGRRSKFSKANDIYSAIDDGITSAATIAEAYGMDRAFAIAPTASCSYNNRDVRGFTTTPELSPPISRSVSRDSDTFGVVSYDYPPDVEIAREVGYQSYSLVADGIVRLLQRTGLFHGYSYNSWSDQVVYDESFIEDWLDSPQTSLYYSLQVDPDSQAKDDALGVLDPELRDMFEFYEPVDTGVCQLNSQECTSCSE